MNKAGNLPALFLAITLLVFIFFFTGFSFPARFFKRSINEPFYLPVDTAKFVTGPFFKSLVNIFVHT